ncbi:MAG: ATP-binding cassette domain-containing protein [Candidatus Eisenbacteria bacterium]|nr:ATP-binding cassette domain-containing protein [Candidatus Eisenbacteria bacterium]
MAEKIVLDNVGVTVNGPDGPEPVLRNVSAAIGEGEMVAVVGPSGSGKTTLLNVVGGLEPSFQGTVLIDGRSVWTSPEAARAKIRGERIGFVFQESNLIAGLSAEENLALPLLLAPHVSQPPRERTRTLLARVGMQDKARIRAERLSGGERQRVATARALVAGPDIVLVDEPTGNLDDETGRRVIEILLEYRTERRATMLIATHDARLMERADRILQLLDGTLHADE